MAEEASDIAVSVIRFVRKEELPLRLDVVVVDGNTDRHFYEDFLPGLEPSVPVIVVASNGHWKARLALSKMDHVTVFPARQADIIAQCLAALERIRAKPRLAMVTKNPLLLKSLKASMGLVPKTYQSEESLWMSLEREVPDAFLLDLDSCGNGQQLAKAIRQDVRTARSLVFAYCNGSDIGDSTLFDDRFDSGLASQVRMSDSIIARFHRNYVVRKLIETDPMTGLGNRRRARARVGLFLRLAHRQGAGLALGILDLDRFKSINDTYGHGVGDRVIKKLGRSMRQFFRAEDVAARIGGEEFMVCMYGVDANTLANRLGALLEKFRSHTFQTSDRGKFQVTFSAGVAQIGDDARDYQALSELADQALYRAKESGRNQVVVSGS